ncbi:hypothetical protein ACODT5_00710 [Streptomyces sp. 5.8]|uniref:hypothetical protein n=1 Tax=Streptomyces sp. 5.8 TaxID=3406571 RepID=UPI003BB4F3BB
MDRVFYRVQWADCPTFNANNAWSAPWGATRSDDGSRTECRTCDGTGRSDNEECPDCEDGWDDCVRGYSCCDTPAELLGYFSGPRPAPEPTDTVIVFEGRQVGAGFDGEPTAIPGRVMETLTWTAFAARHNTAP